MYAPINQVCSHIPKVQELECIVLLVKLISLKLGMHSDHETEQDTQHFDHEVFYWRMQNNCSSSDRFITVQCRICTERAFFKPSLKAVTCNAEKQTVSNGRSLCNYFAYASTE